MKKLIIILIVMLNLHVLCIPNAHSASLDELERYIEWRIEQEVKIRTSQKLAKYIYGRILYWQKVKGIK